MKEKEGHAVTKCPHALTKHPHALAKHPCALAKQPQKPKKARTNYGASLSLIYI